MDLQLHSDQVVIQLQNSLNIAQLSEQKAIYLEALAIKKAITLDGTALVQFDMASLQLLLCFFKTAQQRQIMLTWQGISAELKNMVQLLGMPQLLNLNQTPAH